MYAPAPPQWHEVSRHGFAEVRQNLLNRQNGLFALETIEAGRMIVDFSAGTIGTEPTYLTVQVDTDKHITLQPEFLQYINHGCDPNVFFDTTSMQLIALRDIAPGEELRFFYPSTEWKMKQSFSCTCGSPRCIGKVRGARYLGPQLAAEYRLTDFIQRRLLKKIARKKVA